jgi:Flp pilus assembly protein TadG
MSGAIKAASKMWLGVRRSARDMVEDCSGIAATEFVFIVPLMLTLLFGTIEFSSGLAVDRKVTLIARTLADLPSQAVANSGNAISAQVDDNYLQNVFTASIAIMTPYSPTPTSAQLSEVYVDSTGKATIQWSKAASIGSGAVQATLVASSPPLPPRSPGDDVTNNMPPQLLVKQTYVIWSEVSYLYKPLGIGYVMKSSVTLQDAGFSRPRNATCVIYNNLPAPGPPASPQPCPTP